MLRTHGLLSLVVICTVAVGAIADFVPNSDTWEGSYECTTLPSEAGNGWSTGYTGTFFSVDDTFVRLTNQGDGANLWANMFGKESSGLSPATADTTESGNGFAAEWGFRLPANDSIGEVRFIVTVGSQETYFAIADFDWNPLSSPQCYYKTPGNNEYLITNLADGETHTAQIVLLGNTIEYYIDGSLVDTLSTTPNAGSVELRISAWGRTPGSGNQMVDTDYVRWTNNAIPEPSSMLLMGVGAVGIAFRRLLRK